MGECEVGKVLTVVEETIADNSLILDYGTTIYIFTKKVYFKSLKSEEPSYFVTISGCNWVSIVGWRSVYFWALLDNAYWEVILNKVLYISELGVNLVSLGLLQRSGSTIRSLNNELTVVYMDKDLLYDVIDGENGTLYFIKYVNDSNYTALVISSENMYL